MENKVTVLSNALNECKCGTFVKVAYASIPTMRKTNNPYMGRVVKVSDQTYRFGCSYESMVSKRAEDGQTFKSESINGTWLIPNKVLVSTKGKVQGRFYMVEKPNAKVAYFVDGRLATAEETTEILSFCPSRSSSKKQESVGIPLEKQVKPLDLTLEQIIAIKGDGIDYTDQALAPMYTF